MNFTNKFVRSKNKKSRINQSDSCVEYLKWSRCEPVGREREKHGNIVLFAYNVVKKVIKTCAHTDIMIFLFGHVFLFLFPFSLWLVSRLMTAAVRRGFSFSNHNSPFEVLNKKINNKKLFISILDFYCKKYFSKLHLAFYTNIQMHKFKESFQKGKKMMKFKNLNSFHQLWHMRREKCYAIFTNQSPDDHHTTIIAFP